MAVGEMWRSASRTKNPTFDRDVSASQSHRDCQQGKYLSFAASLCSSKAMITIAVVSVSFLVLTKLCLCRPFLQGDYVCLCLLNGACDAEINASKALMCKLTRPCQEVFRMPSPDKLDG